MGLHISNRTKGNRMKKVINYLSTLCLVILIGHPIYNRGYIHDFFREKPKYQESQCIYQYAFKKIENKLTAHKFHAYILKVYKKQEKYVVWHYSKFGDNNLVYHIGIKTFDNLHHKSFKPLTCDDHLMITTEMADKTNMITDKLDAEESQLK